MSEQRAAVARYVVVEGDDGRRRVARADGLPEPDPNTTAMLPLTKGRVAVVDADDAALLSQWKWSYTDTGYAVRFQRIGRADGRRRKVTIRMHRFILGAPRELEVDHINGDRLDNRRANLRLVTDAQQRQNEGVCRGGSSLFKGVTRSKERGRWEAQIKHQRRRIYLGRFRDEVEAARAYDAAARELFGEFARLNGV